MRKSEISFDSIPASAISTTTVTICLKCAFDFFTRQLKLAARTAYSELKRHVPEEADFSGAATSRPHFFEAERVNHCPYCNASNRWFARFHAIRIDAHQSFEKERKKLWAALRKRADRYVLWNPERTQMEIFSEWLERLKRSTDLNGNEWLLYAALEQIRRSDPLVGWDQVLGGGVRRVQLSRQAKDDWSYDDGWIHVSPALYGDVLIVQHLVSRSHSHGGRTFEGRLTLHELMSRLRNIGYFEARQIKSRDAYEALEEAVAALVASGPSDLYYAVDRADYLEKLKSIYEKKRDK